MHVVLAGAGHQRRSNVRLDRIRDVGKNGAHALRIRPGGLRSFLGAPKLRRGDHFHRLGNLLRRLYGGNAVFQIL